MILHQCTNNHNHTMYDFGVMAWDRQTEGWMDEQKSDI